MELNRKYNVEVLRENFGTYIVPENCKGGIAVDIGCNNGCFLTRYSNYFREIHAYEPNIYLFNLLKKKYSNQQHIYFYNEAIYHTLNEVLSLVKYNHNDEDGSFAVFTDNSKEHWSLENEICKVKTVDIDTVVQRCSQRNIEYLKMDCETGEYYGLINKDLTPFKFIGIELHGQLSAARYRELYEYITSTHTCNIQCIPGTNQEMLFSKKNE
jgi:FkbM family methyltransferase